MRNVENKHFQPQGQLLYRQIFPEVLVSGLIELHVRVSADFFSFTSQFWWICMLLKKGFKKFGSDAEFLNDYKSIKTEMLLFV